MSDEEALLRGFRKLKSELPHSLEWQAGWKEGHDGMVKAWSESMAALARYMRAHPEVDRDEIITALELIGSDGPELVNAMADAAKSVLDKAKN